MQLSDRTGLRVKLHDLHVLMTVGRQYEQGGRAPQYNPTVISRSIAELERTIDLRLLDRNSQGVEMTEYSRVLLDSGAAVFDDLRS